MKDYKLKTPIEVFDNKSSLYERVSLQAVEIMGSLQFIFGTLLLIVLWILAANNNIIQDTGLLHLNLILSAWASIQGSIILFAQEAESKRDRRKAQNDYEVNLHSEEMLQDLHQHEEEQDKAIKLLINQNAQLITYINSQKDKSNNI